ncbi:LIP [Symbiodinium natans]|uniref:LIP protein n=1 Tax=Symbiodinium natans TaxID=878477 RepID=A0A812GYG5_9DINO|nr:LIP [Symbiodinium natans]
MIQDLRIAKNLSDWKTGGSVHTGFLAEWESLRSCIETALKATCSGKEVVVTGHSLGGAICTLAMVDLAQRGWTIKEGYTFGMPRTGDATFAAHFDQMFSGKFFRVTHHMDPVPHVPPQDFGFQHFSSEVFYNGEVGAGFRHCPQAEDLRCAGRYWDLPVDLFHINDHMDYMGEHTGSVGCEGWRTGQPTSQPGGGLAGAVATTSTFNSTVVDPRFTLSV